MDNLKEIANFIDFAGIRLAQASAKMVAKHGLDATDTVLRDDADFILRALCVRLTNISQDIHRIADHVSTSTPIDIDSFK